MNQENPPPHPDPGPSAPHPPYPQKHMGPGPMGGPYPPLQGYTYQGQRYPQYSWQDRPWEPPKTTVYMVEDHRRYELEPSTCLTACWTAFCCCCLWDMLT
ncbi:LOW QUALITY PROTEIN: cysteine-rich and transmembrane domain-containing protein 1 [Pongo abelii]|uniref:LOW QUALITY PROTEIN: cysteine-rich and transmembrane domain-containing protein 1 n=1 Tax=Pongo abelii TaxID=9601 RepID=UPI0030078A4B